MPLNKTAAAYKPEPGSLASRVIDLIARNQEEEFLTRDIATKFEVVSSSVQALLHSPMAHGLLAFDRAEDGSGKVWRAGPQLREWLELRQGDTVAPQVRKPPSARVAAPRVTLGRIDPLTVPIRSGVPVPTADEGRAITAPYAVLWDRMKPGDCVELNLKQMASLLAFLRKRKQPHTVRTTGIGLKTVWRQA